MSGRRATIAAWSLCGVTVALLIANVVVVLADPNASGPAHPGPSGPTAGDTVARGGALFAAFEAMLFSAFALVGAVVATRRSRNPIGWLFSTGAFFLGVTMLGDELYWRIAFGHPEEIESASRFIWIENWSWVPAVVVLFILVPLLFPTGRPPTPRWRFVGWVGAGAGTLTLLATAFAPGPLANYGWVDNPLGVDGLGLGALIDPSFLVCAAAALAAVASLVVRFRRSHGVERQQLKWVTTSGCLLIVSFAAGGILTEVVSEPVGWACMLVGFSIMAVAVGVALLRYRLYDIDVVINRALVYGVLTATLAGSYLGSVLLLQLVLSPSSDLAIATSTLAVAALFRPARRRIQAGVDRRFYRRRYDAERTLKGFGARLRDEVALDALSAELRGVVADTMQPAHVSLWLRTPEASR